ETSCGRRPKKKARKTEKQEDKEAHRGKSKRETKGREAVDSKIPSVRATSSTNSSASSVSSVVKGAIETFLPGAVKRPMPSAIHPMLATPVEKPFDSPEWLFEIKWDGYRAITFLENAKVRLVSRNQNDLTPRYPELRDLPQFVKAKTAILDG